MARSAAVAQDGLFPGVDVSASDLLGVASVARFATGDSKGKQRGKKEERNPRSGLRPSLRLTEPGGEEPEPQYQKYDTKGNPHDQPCESLVLQGIETRGGRANGVERVPDTGRERQQGT